ncbi:MAG TPA: 2-hydroxyacid dehydrogenase [Afifellaceae bacterium]|nr:2-hydroxyacid dehydrogenase [Afifellaceae bacterium]
MKPDVLVVHRLMPHVMEALESAYECHPLWKADDRDSLLAEIGPRVRGIATSGFVGADAALMDACPKLEIISSFGVGYDTIDVAHARKRGVIVTNTPDVLNDEVANTAVALLLVVARKIIAYDRYVRGGRWEREGDPPLTTGIAGKKIGILGFGRIGQVIAEKLAVFHCEVVYHARNERPGLPYRYYGDLVEMARDCLALIVIVPGGAATRCLVDRKVMDALGPQGILINVARGSCVDEPALVAALQEGRLGAAGLDVFDDEPHVPEALFEMDQVVLLPHQGSATVETRKAMGDLVVDNLAAHFTGNPPLTPVS